MTIKLFWFTQYSLSLCIYHIPNCTISIKMRTYTDIDNSNSMNHYVRSCIFALCLFIVFLPIPIAEIVISRMYKDSVVCMKDNTINNNPIFPVNPALWLYIKGIVSLVGFFSIYMSACCEAIINGNRCINICLRLFNIPLKIFLFCWIICGAIMLWSDCPQMSPNYANEMCWVSVIIGLIGFACDKTRSNNNIRLNIYMKYNNQ